MLYIYHSLNPEVNHLVSDHLTASIAKKSFCQHNCLCMSATRCTYIRTYNPLWLFSVDCGPPPEIANGTFIGGTFTTVGNTAFYYCNDFSATRVGNSTITCQDDGTWEDPPLCVLPSKCMNWYTMPHHTISGDHHWLLYSLVSIFTLQTTYQCMKL